MFLEPVLKFILELIKIFYYGRKKHKLSTEREDSPRGEEHLAKIYYPPAQDLGFWGLAPNPLPQLNKYGCYFFSLFFISNLIRDLSQGGHTYIKPAFIKLIFKGLEERHIIKKNAYVLDPQGIIREFGLNHTLRFAGKKEPYKKYSESDILISQYDYKDLSHFVVETYKGDLLFDPLDNSIVYKKGKPVSVRRFEIIERDAKANYKNLCRKISKRVVK